MKKTSKKNPKSRHYKILLSMAAVCIICASSGLDARAQQEILAGQDSTENSSQDQAKAPAISTDQIILKYLPGSLAFHAPGQAAQMERLSQKAGTSLRFLRSMSDGVIVLRLPERLPAARVLAMADQLMALAEVEYAEPDAIMQHTLIPNDPMYGSQWNYFAPTSGNYGINAPTAWDISTGAASIVIADIDTGITNHADLSGRTVPGYDFIGDVLMANDGDGRDNNPSDPGDWVTEAESASGYFAGCEVSSSSWHGTHTAGTIGAASNNGIGVTGVDWNSKILPVRVLGKCGGYTSDIADGMRWAAGLPVSGVPANPNPARVENLSLGGPGSCGSTMQNAINAVTSAGTTIVVSAGNDNTSASGFSPASCNGVITVSATSRSGGKASYSNYGSKVEISAPGGDGSSGILSTLNTGTQGPVADTYAFYQGTSMAAPHVSGVAALLYSLNPALTPGNVVQILQNTATSFPPGSSCTTSMCGSGIVNAGAAVASIPFSNHSIYLPMILRDFLPPSDPTLTVNKNGSGMVTSNPTGIDCGAACSHAFAYNAVVTLTAVPESPAIFAGWGGGNCSGTGSCQVTMNTDQQVLATFRLPSLTCSGLQNCDFESGTNDEWTEYSTQEFDIIYDCSASPTCNGITPHSGIFVAWLGGIIADPPTLTEKTFIQQQISIASNASFLTYWQWIASEDICGSDYDYAEVFINDALVEKYELCDPKNTYGWEPHNINLMGYAGQSVLLRMQVTTDFVYNSNLFIDDVSLMASPLSSISLPTSTPNQDFPPTRGKTMGKTQSWKSFGRAP